LLIFPLDFPPQGSVAGGVRRIEKMKTLEIETLETVIKANLGALADLLTCAAKAAARDHAHAAQRNTPIGAIVDLDRLLGAAIALHRRAPM